MSLLRLGRALHSLVRKRCVSEVALLVLARFQAEMATDYVIKRLVAIAFSIPQFFANCLGHPNAGIGALAGFVV